MPHTTDEMRDVPLLHNDMTESLPTTDRPLDTADGPGKADAELGLDPDGEDTPGLGIGASV